MYVLLPQSFCFVHTSHTLISFYFFVCLSEFHQTEKRRSRLFCRYQDGSRNPRLLLKPMKEEDEWDSPHIVRYLEALSDYEIEKIKQMAKPRVRKKRYHIDIREKIQ